MPSRRWLDEIHRLVWRGEDRLAERRVRGRLAKEPEDGLLWILWAELCMRQGRLADGKEALVRARALSPQSPRLLVAEGDLHLLEGDACRAADCYEQAVDAAPASAGRRLLHALRILGRIEELIQVGQALLARAPDPAVAVQVAAALTEAGRPMDALSILARVRQKHPEDAALTDHLLALKRQLLPPPAHDSLRQGRVPPGADADPDLCLLAAEDALRRGLVPQAVSLYRAVLSHRAHDTYALRRLAYALRLQGRAEDGLAALQQAFELAPGDWATRTALVSLYRELGRESQGAAYFRRFLSRHRRYRSLWAAVRELSRERAAPAPTVTARRPENAARIPSPPDLPSIPGPMVTASPIAHHRITTANARGKEAHHGR